MKYLKAIYRVVQGTAVQYGRDNGPLLSAALAYYALFAIAPLLVIAVSVAGFVFGQAAVEGRIVSNIQGFVGRDAALLIQDLIVSIRFSDASGWVTALGFGVLFITASNLFAQLERVLNTIWGIGNPPNPGIILFVRKRLLSFAMVIMAGFLVTVSLIISTLITTLWKVFASLMPGFGQFLPVIDFTLSLVILTGVFTLIFKVLPDAHVSWRDMGVGGFVTAVLFSLGKYLISLYLIYSRDTGLYQAAGSILVLLVWIYFSAQIVLFGAEFTQQYANRYGASIRPYESRMVRTWTEVEVE